MNPVANTMNEQGLVFVTVNNLGPQFTEKEQYFFFFFFLIIFFLFLFLLLFFLILVVKIKIYILNTLPTLTENGVGQNHYVACMSAHYSCSLSGLPQIPFTHVIELKKHEPRGAFKKANFFFFTLVALNEEDLGKVA